MVRRRATLGGTCPVLTSCQLATGCVDVIAARLAHRGDDPSPEQLGSGTQTPAEAVSAAGQTLGELKGIRLNLHHLAWAWLRTKPDQLLAACSGWSLTPSSMQYSKVMKSRGAWSR